jgi:hypothetical protein
MAIFYDEKKQKIKTIHAGLVGYEDYTQHKDEFRKARYISRHSNENWNDPMTAGSLARYVLWEKPSLQEGIKYYRKKFDLGEYKKND